MSIIQVWSNGTVWSKKNKNVKTVETHSFLLLTHNFLAINTRKFQQPMPRRNLFNTNWSRYPSLIHYFCCLQIIYHPVWKMLKNHKLSRSPCINQKIKNCPKILILTKTLSLSRDSYVNQKILILTKTVSKFLN